jgi:hypothetical protein
MYLFIFFNEYVLFFSLFTFPPALLASLIFVLGGMIVQKIQRKNNLSFISSSKMWTEADCDVLCMG